LACLKPVSSGAFRLRVADQIVPENEGPWRVEFGPAGTTSVPDSGGDLPLVEVDIATFSGAFFGHPGWRQMHRMGLVTADATTLDTLEALMPTGLTYHSELY
ncbi:MAG: sterol carrier protein domain-containing protein, partial [Armatimonadota bacterium]